MRRASRGCSLMTCLPDGSRIYARQRRSTAWRSGPKRTLSLPKSSSFDKRRPELVEGLSPHIPRLAQPSLLSVSPWAEDAEEAQDRHHCDEYHEEQRTDRLQGTAPTPGRLQHEASQAGNCHETSQDAKGRHSPAEP